MVANKHTIKGGSDADIKYLADNLRAIDRQEIFEVSGFDPVVSLAFARQHSRDFRIRFFDGKPAVAYGVSTFDPLAKEGCVWLLGTDAIDKHPLIFARYVKGVIDELRHGYSNVFNYCRHDNHKTLNLLYWLGFTIDDPVPFGRFNIPYRRISLCAMQ